MGVTMPSFLRVAPAFVCAKEDCKFKEKGDPIIVPISVNCPGCGTRHLYSRETRQYIVANVAPPTLPDEQPKNKYLCECGHVRHDGHTCKECECVSGYSDHIGAVAGCLLCIERLEAALDGLDGISP